MTLTSDQFLSQLVLLTKRFGEVLEGEFTDQSEDDDWPVLLRRYVDQTGGGNERLFADAVAQSVACGQLAIRLADPLLLTPHSLHWLISQADPLVQRVLQFCVPQTSQPTSTRGLRSAAARISEFLGQNDADSLRRQAAHRAQEEDPSVYFYERFLQAYDHKTRRRKGVFYTPAKLVSFVVRSVDQLLQDEFQLPTGLGDATNWNDLANQSGEDTAFPSDWGWQPFVQVLDPAMGTGAFLLAVLDTVHQRFVGLPSSYGPEDWDTFVEESLLPRIHGLELMLPPLVLAQIQMTIGLAQTGYRFRHPAPFQFHLTNTLRKPYSPTRAGNGLGLPFTVVIGNPPFSGVSANQHHWIQQLLRGTAEPGGKPVADYFSAEGRPLGERKHWLQDDYVKFIRYAHWQTERAGTGILAFVTNHGFLDNSTFRGMRQQLMQTYPWMTLIDLHGNKRGAEGGPTGKDDSVFPIEQGVAVSFLRRPMKNSPAADIQYAELWGRRAEKLGLLNHSIAQTLESHRLKPGPPHFFLVPKNEHRRVEYEQGHRLVDIMPQNSTAAVTARDGFVVAIDRLELQDRITQFRDLDIPDETIRDRFFTATRSSRHAPGDTRGWKLSTARQRMHGERMWKKHLRECLYRPFDRRWIFWTDWMIDWPRNNLMRHMYVDGNLALVARRQTPPALPCNFFWVTDTIVLDGLIRSDNRGSESFFPLFLFEPSNRRDEVGGYERRANFTPGFLEFCERRCGLRWSAEPRQISADCFGPDDLFHFIYAQFHAPSYRQRFADWLRVDFPRVFIPPCPELFHALRRIGRQLIDAHLLSRPIATSPSLNITPPVTVEPGFPKFDDHRIRIGQAQAIGPVDPEVWSYRVGAHQVCRKWLKDRRGRVLEHHDLAHLSQMIAATQITRQLSQEIDRRIEQSGGWETAFAIKSM